MVQELMYPFEEATNQGMEREGMSSSQARTATCSHSRHLPSLLTLFLLFFDGWPSKLKSSESE